MVGVARSGRRDRGRNGKTQLLVGNPLDRDLIDSPMPPQLRTAADGSLTLHTPPQSPGGRRRQLAAGAERAVLHGAADPRTEAGAHCRRLDPAATSADRLRSLPLTNRVIDPSGVWRLGSNGAKGFARPKAGPARSIEALGRKTAAPPRLSLPSKGPPPSQSHEEPRRTSRPSPRQPRTRCAGSRNPQILTNIWSKILPSYRLERTDICRDNLKFFLSFDE